MLPEETLDTTDIAALTEVVGNQALPLSGDLEQTQHADPVEQAILVDQTKPRSQRSEPSASRERPEIRCGSYRLLEPIAQGGMGILYMGEHVLLGKRAAIKILQPSLHGDEQVERRFFAEAIATARIQHPGVPAVLDYGRNEQGAPYIVLEYLDGQTLEGLMMSGTQLPLEQILAIARDMAVILGAAHSLGILHRDIKPANVHLEPDPEAQSGFKVRILDFGVAKFLADRPDEAAHTRHDYLVGTAWYMAPEQTFGPAGVDERSDVYAIGCVLFQLLTGRLPFAGEFEEVVQARRYTDAPVASSLCPTLPALVDSLIARMLARDPDARPSSMAALERELDQICVAIASPSATGPVPDRSDRSVQRLHKYFEVASTSARKHPRIAVALGSLMAILCGIWVL